MSSLVSKCSAHLDTINESYLQHSRFAIKSGCHLIIAGLACIIHGLVPGALESTGSRKTKELAQIFERRSAAAERNMAARRFLDRAA